MILQTKTKCKEIGFLLLSCKALERWTFLEQKIERDSLELSWRLAGAAALKRGMEILKTESLFQTAMFSKLRERKRECMS